MTALKFKCVSNYFYFTKFLIFFAPTFRNNFEIFYISSTYLIESCLIELTINFITSVRTSFYLVRFLNFLNQVFLKRRFCLRLSISTCFLFRCSVIPIRHPRPINYFCIGNRLNESDKK